MKTRIFFFTNHYPYVEGGEDVFVAPEVSEFSKFFDEVVVVPLGRLTQTPLKIEEENVIVNVTLVDLLEDSKKKRLIQKAIKVLDTDTLASILGWLRSKDRFSLQRGYAQIGFLYRVQLIKSWIINHLPQRGDSILGYSYWLYDAALAMALAKKEGVEFVSVSRAHRFDLYEELSGYTPLRWLLLKHLDRVFTISKHGQNYLSQRYPAYADKLQNRYIGSASPRERCRKSSDGNLRILSVSNLVPVKRPELLIKSIIQLSKLTSRKVIWTHFGSGPLFDAVAERLNKSDTENLTAHLKGHVPNEEMHKALEGECYDVFVNTSASEGLPVSIMEASSLGIPTVATDVGGVREIVLGAGRLVSENASEKDIAEAILDLVDSEDFDDARQHVASQWQKTFDASKNAVVFCKDLRELVK